MRYAHTENEKKVKAQRNAQTVRENLKASTQHTQAEEAADAHMQDNYRPPETPRPPPPEVDATMGDSHRPPPPPPPPPVGQPEFIPMRETFNNKNVKTHVRKKTKNHNAAATRQAEIIKAQVAKNERPIRSRNGWEFKR